MRPLLYCRAMERITSTQARRLLLARAGLLGKQWSGLPSSAGRSKASAQSACYEVIGRFGYLQLDTVSIAGARSQALVLMSRIQGLKAEVAEELLRPGVPLFEYWGHEASWIPLDLYPVFAFRRREFKKHPWWGDIIGKNKKLAKNVMQRIRNEGALRSVDLEGKGSSGWWDLKLAKRVALALWSSGDLAIRERRRFQRSYDLPDRVLPKEALSAPPVPKDRAVRTLLMQALDGHGVATTAVLSQTWRFSKMRPDILRALERLQEEGEIAPCRYDTQSGKSVIAWIRPRDLELLDRLAALRPRRDRGVLLSPFDPVLWDRRRVMDLFGFHQVLEIFTPEPKRTYGYFCLPVLAGDRLVARVDLKADRKQKRLSVLSVHYEDGRPSATVKKAVGSALTRYAKTLRFEVSG